MRIKLPYKLMSKAHRGHLPAVDCVLFLKTKGFETPLPIMNTSLGDMTYGSKKVKDAKIDLACSELVLLLEDIENEPVV